MSTVENALQQMNCLLHENETIDYDLSANWSRFDLFRQLEIIRFTQ